MWEAIGLVVAGLLFSFGLNTLLWTLRGSWFNPDFPRHHKIKVPTTSRRR